jgi:23S rRNA (adenine2503-C2)-methyltransferase
MKHILNVTPEQFAGEIVALGEKSYRAGQILDWIWNRGGYRFDEMTNLSLDLRRKLSELYTIFSGTVTARFDADDGVMKLLLAFPDREQVETVLIPSESRRTACLSTQAGCAMGCSFCASGLGGLRRNLTSGEIIEQVLQLQHASGQQVTNVVFMGTGEPLANYTATISAVRALASPRQGGISARRITVSTVGLPEGIRRLAKENLPITLAISLHAPTDALRASLLPGAAKYPIRDVLAAAEEFFRSRKREVTLEYVLLAGVNDTRTCAKALAQLARRIRCNVNLIGYNPVSAMPYQRPDDAQIQAFSKRLRERGVNVTIRHSRGSGVNAACGQLRRRTVGTLAENRPSAD